VIERDGLLDNVRTVGALLRERIAGAGNPLVAGVRGRGLLLAVQLARPVAADVARAALDAGLVVNAVAPAAIRLAPPLVPPPEQARDVVAFFATVSVPGSEDATGAPATDPTTPATPTTRSS